MRQRLILAILFVLLVDSLAFRVEKFQQDSDSDGSGDSREYSFMDWIMLPVDLKEDYEILAEKICEEELAKWVSPNSCPTAKAAMRGYFIRKGNPVHEPTHAIKLVVFQKDDQKVFIYYLRLSVDETQILKLSVAEEKKPNEYIFDYPVKMAVNIKKQYLSFRNEYVKYRNSKKGKFDIPTWEECDDDSFDDDLSVKPEDQMNSECAIGDDPDECDDKVLPCEVSTVNKNGQVIGQDGMVIGKEDDKQRIINASGQQVAKVAADESIVDMNGKRILGVCPQKPNKQKEVYGPFGNYIGSKGKKDDDIYDRYGNEIGKIGQGGIVYDEKGKVVIPGPLPQPKACIGPNGVALKPDESVLGYTDENSMIRDEDGIVIAQVDMNGIVTAIDGTTMYGPRPLPLAFGTPVATHNDAKLVTLPDGSVIGQVQDGNRIINDEDLCIGYINEFDEVVNPVGNPITKYDPQDQFYRFAFANAHGEILGHNAELFGTASNGDGKVYDISKNPIGTVGKDGIIRDQDGMAVMYSPKRPKNSPKSETLPIGEPIKADADGYVDGPDGSFFGIVRNKKVYSDEGEVVGFENDDGTITDHDGTILRELPKQEQDEWADDMDDNQDFDIVNNKQKSIRMNKKIDIPEGQKAAKPEFDGTVYGADGEVFGQAGADMMVRDKIGNVIGQVNDEGYVLDLQSKVMTVPIDLKPHVRMSPKMVVLRAQADGYVVKDGKLFGEVGTDGNVKDQNGELVAKVGKQGEVIGLDGKPIMVPSNDNKFELQPYQIPKQNLAFSRTMVHARPSPDGQVMGPDGILGKVGAASMIFDGQGNVVGKVNENGYVMDKKGLPVMVPQDDSIPDRARGMRMNKARTPATPDADGQVFDQDGQLMGVVGGDSIVRDSDNKEVGKVQSDGTVLDTDGKLVFGSNLTGTNTPAQPNPDGTVTGPDGRLFGYVEANGKVTLEGQQVGKVNSDGTVSNLNGRHVMAPEAGDMKAVLPNADGDVISPSGIYLGSVDYDSKIRDQDGHIVAKLNKDGTVSDMQGTLLMMHTSGTIYDPNYGQRNKGMSFSKMYQGRFATPNQDGTVTGPNGRSIGTLGGDKQIRDYSGRVVAKLNQDQVVVDLNGRPIFGPEQRFYTPYGTPSQGGYGASPGMGFGSSSPTYYNQYNSQNPGMGFGAGKGYESSGYVQGLDAFNKPVQGAMPNDDGTWGSENKDMKVTGQLDPQVMASMMGKGKVTGLGAELLGSKVGLQGLIAAAGPGGLSSMPGIKTLKHINGVGHNNKPIIGHAPSNGQYDKRLDKYKNRHGDIPDPGLIQIPVNVGPNGYDMLAGFGVATLINNAGGINEIGGTSGVDKLVNPKKLNKAMGGGKPGDSNEDPYEKHKSVKVGKGMPVGSANSHKAGTGSGPNDENCHSCTVADVFGDTIDYFKFTPTWKGGYLYYWGKPEYPTKSRFPVPIFNPWIGYNDDDYDPDEPQNTRGPDDLNGYPDNEPFVLFQKQIEEEDSDYNKWDPQATRDPKNPRAYNKKLPHLAYREKVGCEDSDWDPSQPRSTRNPNNIYTYKIWKPQAEWPPQPNMNDDFQPIPIFDPKYYPHQPDYDSRNAQATRRPQDPLGYPAGKPYIVFYSKINSWDWDFDWGNPKKTRGPNNCMAYQTNQPRQLYSQLIRKDEDGFDSDDPFATRSFADPKNIYENPAPELYEQDDLTPLKADQLPTYHEKIKQSDSDYDKNHPDATRDPRPWLPWIPTIYSCDEDYDPEDPYRTRDPHKYFSYHATIHSDDSDYDPSYPDATRKPVDPRPVLIYSPKISHSDDDYDPAKPDKTRNPLNPKAYIQHIKSPRFPYGTRKPRPFTLKYSPTDSDYDPLLPKKQPNAYRYLPYHPLICPWDANFNPFYPEATRNPRRYFEYKSVIDMDDDEYDPQCPTRTRLPRDRRTLIFNERIQPGDPDFNPRWPRATRSVRNPASYSLIDEIFTSDDDNPYRTAVPLKYRPMIYSSDLDFDPEHPDRTRDPRPWLPYSPHIGPHDMDYNPRDPKATRDPRPYFPYDPIIRPGDSDYDAQYPLATRAPKDPRPVPVYDPAIHRSDSDYDSNHPDRTRSPKDPRAYPILDPTVQLIKSCKKEQCEENKVLDIQEEKKEAQLFHLAIPTLDAPPEKEGHRFSKKKSEKLIKKKLLRMKQISKRLRK